MHSDFLSFLKQTLRRPAAFALLLSFLLGVFLLSGCSVKEDRTNCPTWLTFLSSTADDDLGDRLYFYAFREGALEFDDLYRWSDFVTVGIDVPIMRGALHFAGFVGWPEDWIRDGVLSIPYGSDAPEAWGFDDKRVVEEGQFVFDEAVRMLFANVFIHVVGQDETYPWTLVLEGNVDGYVLPSLAPHSGEYSSIPFDMGEAMHHSRIPRQMDDSLLLSLYEDHPLLHPVTKGPVKEWPDPVFSLPVGQIVAMSGYDWGASIFPDIHIELDFAALSVNVTIGEWKYVMLMDNGRFKI